MRIEVLSVSKYRDGVRVGDDVPLVMPGAVFGVFDGATDPRGTVVDGVGAGRLAALTAAAAMAELAADPAARELPVQDILGRVTEALARRCAPLGLPIPPSTTLAVALDCGADWRFIGLGDTGIRINGDEVIRYEKPIDAVSTRARVAVFHQLATAQRDADEVESAARRAILLGLDLAVAEGVLGEDDARRIIASTVEQTGLQGAPDVVERFLRGGIKTQYVLGNDPRSPLGFDTLNGTAPVRGDFTDLRRPKDRVRSIEIFTDGYPDLPADVSAAAWEAAFDRAETEDPHKVGRFATVKGSTSSEFFDDRTVIVLS
ncbi:hypothetical protein [Wenxinia marina]|uniref:Wenxma_15, whole genome shotgun sequence n=1 Tax=Wenxinia marina DSM 24838 TaxID=1123501 RepID=A0A0D0Q114_9RHOB|nr:hypothetical protein [Wenxinia marina]KIQ68219.1 hypothetical protein Wenmar_03229 [Wenxinia marina DSM 24838]GGL76843.1 hypothetical protein GCM10011392_34130 [Wenxinia marina]